VSITVGTTATGANQGTCTVSAYVSTANTGTGGSHYLYAIVAAKTAMTNRLSIRAQNSTTSQVFDAEGESGAAALTGIFSVVNPTAINMANPQYVNVFITNSVATDHCFLSQADVVVWP
jgi:hypothetical protein